MAIDISAITLNRLYENFHSVISQPGMILSPKLEPTPGLFSTCPHNRVFAATLRVLTDSTAESVEHQGLLIELRETIQAYTLKVATASRLAAKAKGRPLSIDETVVEKIFNRLRELHAQVSRRDSSTCTERCIEEFVPKTEEEFSSLLNQVRGMTTEWYFFKALGLCSRVISLAQTHRTQLLAQQYRLGLMQHGNTFLPPPNYFKAPWPILLLGNKLDTVINANPRDDDECQRILFRLLEAQKIYTTHADVITGILLTARFQKTHTTSKAMMVECTKTLAMIRERIPQAGLGTALNKLIENLDSIQPTIVRLERERETVCSSFFPSDDLRFEAGEQVDAQYSEILNQIGLFFATATTTFKESLPALLKTYQKCLVTLTSYHEEHHNQHVCRKQKKELEFCPVLPSPIFRPNGFFSANITPTLPSVEEMGAFAPFAFPLHLDTRIQEHESLKDEGQGFLPKDIQTQPAPRRRRQPKKRTHHEPQLPVPPPSPKEPSHEEPSPSIPQTVTRSPQSISPPIEKISQLSLCEKRCGFHVGAGPDPTLQFSRHVRRWKIPDLDPFIHDPQYRDRHFSREVQEGIYFQHTPPLALIHIIREYGEEFINIDGIRKSYFLPAEATWYDGSGRYEKGVVALGLYRPTGEIVHYSFSLQSTSTHRQYLHRENFFQPYIDEVEKEESGLELDDKKVNPFKTLPSDRSEICQISENDRTGIVEVTVNDPIRQLQVTVFFDIVKT